MMARPAGAPALVLPAELPMNKAPAVLPAATRRSSGQAHAASPFHFVKQRLALVPPKPKLLDSATSTTLA